MQAPVSLARQFVPRKALYRLTLYVGMVGVAFACAVLVTRSAGFTSPWLAMVDKYRIVQREGGAQEQLLKVRTATAAGAAGIGSVKSSEKVVVVDVPPVQSTLEKKGDTPASTTPMPVPPPSKAAAKAPEGPSSLLLPGPNGCATMKKMIMLHWDPHWAWHRHPNSLADFINCATSARKRLCVTWYTTSDRSYADKADIIIAHDWSGYPALPKRAFPNQLFMYMTMESPYSGYSSQGMQQLFNLEYKYPLNSHVRAAYIPIGENSFKEIHGAPHFSFKERHENAVSSLVSNCGGFVPRSDFMKSLNPLVPIHSFGACFHNHDLQSHGDISPLEKYKVAMVFENSLCYDYVTEKFWRALTQGTIPLVTSNEGIPDYRKYAPTLHAYVNFADYKDVQELSVQLKKIMSDEKLYDKYLEHRFLPEHKLNPLFRENFSNSTCDDFCRLSDKMANPVEMAALAKRRNPQDTSCRKAGVLK